MADDLGLPKSSLQKAIKDLLPGDMRIAGDASDLLVACCNQFVHLVSTQANAVSEREKRSTISPEHVVKALEELEFGRQYVEAAKAAWDEWKVDNKEHQHQKLVHKKSGVKTGLTQQQLIELQHKLFEEARAATLSGPLPSLTLTPDPSAALPPMPAPAPAAGQQSQQEEQQQQVQLPPLPPPQQQEQQQQPAQAGDGSAEAAAAVQHTAAAAAPAAAADAGGEGENYDDDDLDDVGDVDSEIVGA